MTGAADRRQTDGRGQQLDGCSYHSAGSRLSYVVWRLPRAANASDVAPPGRVLPPGARTFDPGLTLSGGLLLPAGRATISQVSAGDQNVLVEVNTSAGSAASAQHAAVSAAGELLRAGLGAPAKGNS